MLLRIFLFLVGCVLLAIGLSHVGAKLPAGPFLILGVLLIISALFERGRYRSSRTAPTQDEEPTGEVFDDPTTGKRVTVFYNKRTGTRRYVEQQDVPHRRS